MTRRETLIAYLLSSVEAEDWHAVRDAAVDIEVLDATARTASGTTHVGWCQCDRCVRARASV